MRENVMRVPIATIVSLILLVGGSADGAEKPNIVLILADDLGYGDLKCYGHPYARTPNIDKLARQGTRFTQYYSNGATCCPARTALMTGKFCASFQKYPADHGFGTSVTVTELLGQAGYRTGHFGKWHIGPETKAGTYGIGQIDGVEDGIRAIKRANLGDRGRDRPIFDAAIRFVEANKSNPFYINIWGHISHNPVNPAQALVEKWKRLEVRPADFPPQMREKLSAVEAEKGDISDAMGRYLAEVEALDADVGRLMASLETLGLARKTIVVFSSDQGADMTKAGLGGLRFNQMGYNGEFRGGKHTFFEGGQRVPFIVRWPGRVAENSVNEKAVISGVDWLPTLCAITGIPKVSPNLDGENVSAVWQGNHRERTKPLLWKTNNAKSEMAIRDGKWKLMDPNRKKGRIELFDIVADPAESENLASRHPEVVKRLTGKIAMWNATLPKEYTKSNDKD